MDLQFWLTILTIFGSLAGMTLKHHLDNKSNKKALTKRDKILADSLRGMENELVKVGMNLSELKKDREFRNVLRNSIRSKASQLINLSYELEQDYKDILMSWSDHIEDVAFRFYYSPYRNNRREMEKYLRSDIESKKANIRHLINGMITETKYFKGNENRQVLFSDFLETVNVYKKIEILILTLAQNGLKSDDVVRVFTEFIEQFFEDFIKSIIIWRTLSDDKKAA